MELPFERPRLRLVLLIVSLATAAILAFQAGEIWLANHRINSRRLELMERGAALVPGNGDAWDHLGRYRQWGLEDPDPSGAIADYRKAVQDNPLSAHYWMDLASAHEAAGQNAGAQKAFDRAKAVYPMSAEVTWNYGNFLLRQQRYSEGYGEIQQAVRADATFLPLAISRTWRSTEDVRPLLDQVLPAEVNAYLQALDFFGDIHQAKPGLAVWQRLLGLGKPFALSRAFPFLDELIREDRSGDARRVWVEALAAAGLPHDEPANHSVNWDGDFAGDFANGGLGWRWDSPLGVSIDFDSARSPGGGARSVRLDFGGGTNLALDHPSQFVPVEPNRAYHFRAYLRTEGITTESGVRFSIVDPNHPGAVNLLTDGFTGTHTWMPVDADLTAGPDTHFLLVRLFRNPSRLFDNKLGGTAWINDVSLVPSGAQAEHPSR